MCVHTKLLPSQHVLKSLHHNLLLSLMFFCYLFDFFLLSNIIVNSIAFTVIIITCTTSTANGKERFQRVGSSEWDHLLLKSKLSMTDHGHHKDGWPLCTRLCAHPKISPESNDFVHTPRFLQSQILCRLYKSPSDETTIQGPPCEYTCQKITYIC